MVEAFYIADEVMTQTHDCEKLKLVCKSGVICVDVVWMDISDLVYAQKSFQWFSRI